MSDQYETHDDDDSQRFDDPVKIAWRGDARSRISEYNADFDEENSGDGPLSPERFLLAVNRLKTRVVCATVEEAEAVRYEVGNYDYRHRTWMNASMGRSLARVSEKLDEAMSDRGYEPVSKGDTFRGYFPADEAEERQARVDRELREAREERRDRKETIREIYGRLHDSHPVKAYYDHGDEAKIAFKRKTDPSEAESAVPVLEDAGCTNVRVEAEEYTGSRASPLTEGEAYTAVSVVGEIPETGFGLDD